MSLIIIHIKITIYNMLLIRDDSVITIINCNSLVGAYGEEGNTIKKQMSPCIISKLIGYSRHT